MHWDGFEKFAGFPKKSVGRLWLSDLVSFGLLFDPKPQIGSVVQGLGSGEGLSSSVTILHFNNWTWSRRSRQVCPKA